MTEFDSQQTQTVGNAYKRLHPLSLIADLSKTVRNLLVPLAFGGVSIAIGNYNRFVIYFILCFAAFAMAYAIAHYLSFRYRYTEEELEIRSGFISRQRRTIPTARIQNIELRRKLWQRLCGVIEIRIETASGGEAAEAVLSVVSQRAAETLRATMLAGRQAQTVDAHSHSSEQESGRALDAENDFRSANTPTEDTTLVRLRTRDLARAGATSNQMGLIVAALYGLSEFVERLPIGLPSLKFDPAGITPHTPWAGYLIVAVTVLVLIAVLGWAISVAGAIVGYHGYLLELRDQDLHKSYGLLDRREGIVPLRRVQAVRIEESLLRRRFALASLKIESAGGGEDERQRGGAEVFVPILRLGELDGVLARVLPGFSHNVMHLSAVHPLARRRAATRNIALGIIATAIGVWLVGIAALLALLILIPLGYLLAHWAYVNRGYAVSDRHVISRAGVLNRRTWVIPLRRVQTLHLTASPFQQRHGLATLTIDTAAGGGRARIADIAEDSARLLLQEIADGTLAASRAESKFRLGMRRRNARFQGTVNSYMANSSEPSKT